MGRAIMLQGTGSHVGKSILTTALCRILRDEGYSVAPFKSQNMALNSFVTPDGLELGRAQALQAEACGLEPAVDMNPILLKPSGEMSAQVVVMGKPLGQMTAREYRENYLPHALDVVSSSLNRLLALYDVVVIEGAGSPVEMNLRHRDVVNMRVAKLANAPVLMIGDIDRGGIFASLSGTINLLPEDEKALVKGLIVNKFRGDISLFANGRSMLEDLTQKKVLGVIPHLFNLDLDEEDSVGLDNAGSRPMNADINLAVVKLPRISNFTDFSPFQREPGVHAYYTESVEDCLSADAIIIPGTKNTQEDLAYLRAKGLDKAIIKAAESGKVIVGICGGFQILGDELHDPYGVEGSQREALGLSLLPIRTVFGKEKVTRRINANCLLPYFEGSLSGYEIHMGETSPTGPHKPAFLLDSNHQDGAQNSTGTIWGTYLHGVFDDDAFRHSFLTSLRRRKNLTPHPTHYSYKQHRKNQLDRLAAHVRTHMDMDYILGLVKQNQCQ